MITAGPTGETPTFAVALSFDQNKSTIWLPAFFEGMDDGDDRPISPIFGFDEDSSSHDFLLEGGESKSVGIEQNTTFADAMLRSASLEDHNAELSVPVAAPAVEPSSQKVTRRATDAASSMKVAFSPPSSAEQPRRTIESSNLAHSFPDKFQKELPFPSALDVLKEDTTQSMPNDFQPGEWDIICGRGKGMYNKPGNIRFRSIVKSFVPQYQAAKGRVERGLLLNAIIDAAQSQDMQQYGTRARLLKKRKGLWYELSREQAREKVGHIIRQAVEEFESSMTSTSPPTSPVTAPSVAAPSVQSPVATTRMHSPVVQGFAAASMCNSPGAMKDPQSPAEETTDSLEAQRSLFGQMMNRESLDDLRASVGEYDWDVLFSGAPL